MRNTANCRQINASENEGTKGPRLRKETWRITLLSAYGAAAVCLVLLGLIRTPVVLALLLIPFLIIQLHKLITNVRLHVISFVNVSTTLFAIFVFLYLILKSLP